MPKEPDITIEDSLSSQAISLEQSSTINHLQRSTPALPILALIGLAIVALIPRLILAIKLDIVTDEVVYLWGAKVYLPLIEHLNFSAPQWGTANIEHPPLVKILIGICIDLNNVLGQPIAELLAGRLPSVIMGTVLVVAVYWLGRKPFGDTIALIAALALAVSPWLSYFSAIAYLDMTMTSFITLAYLVLWHATRRPWLFLIVAILVGLGADSKYPAVFVVPGIVLYTAYYYFLLRPKMPAEERPPLPWRWWIAAVIISPLSFFVVDPAIWAHPIGRLIHSFAFEANHSVKGHPIYIAGENLTHVPKWTIVYMVFTKMSAFLTISAAFFIIFVLVMLVLFHLRKYHLEITSVANYAYLLIWFMSILGMFSLLNIAVGSHYYLPLAPPLAIAGVSGMAVVLRYLAGLIWKKVLEQTVSHRQKAALHPGIVVPTLLLAMLAIVPGLIGVITINGAEGYTNEFFANDENARLQVAYPDYGQALQWLETQNAPNHASVALIGSALNGYGSNSNWFYYNHDLTQRFQLEQVDPTSTSTDPKNKVNYQRLQVLSAAGYDYLVWPKDVLQRGNSWTSQYHVVYTMMGGNTIYCYLLARNT